MVLEKSMPAPEAHAGLSILCLLLYETITHTSYP